MKIVIDDDKFLSIFRRKILISFLLSFLLSYLAKAKEYIFRLDTKFTFLFSNINKEVNRKDDLWYTVKSRAQTSDRNPQNKRAE